MRRLILLAFLLQSSFLGISQIVLDDFNDNMLTGWSPANNPGNTHTLTEANGELKIDFSITDPTQFPNSIKSFPIPLNLTGVEKMTLKLKTSTPITQIANIRIDLLDTSGKSTSLNPFELDPIITDGVYHDYEYDFTGKWKHVDGSVTDSSQIASLIVFINTGGGGTPNGAGTIFMDEIIMKVSPCMGVTPDLNILEDFDCQSNIQNLFTSGVLATVDNPDVTTFNTSANAGRYIRDTSTFDVFVGNFPVMPADLTTFNKLKVQMIAPAAGMGFQAILQDAGGSNLGSSFINNAVAGVWEELVFDFSAQAATPGVTQILLLINPGSNVQDTFYMDNIRMDSSATPVTVCSGTVYDPLILDDFECQRNLQNLFTTGVLTTIDNPDTSTFNSSAKSGYYIRDTSTFDVFVGGFQGAPIDLTTFNKVKVQVIAPVAGMSFQAILQDAGGSTLGSSSVSNAVAGEWEELVFDFSAQAATPGVTQLLLLLDPGSNARDTFYVDNIRLDSSATPLTVCSGTVTNPLILDDFECQRNLLNFITAGTFSIIDNPDGSSFNASAKSAKYVRSNSTFDVVIGEFAVTPVDLTVFNKLKVQVISPTVGVNYQVSLQDAASTQVAAMSASGTVTGEWEELVFDFSSVSTATNVAKVVFLIDPGNTVVDTFYLDNIRMDSSAVAANECTGIAVNDKIVDDFECQRNLQNPSISGVLTEVDNPLLMAPNMSTTAGKYIRGVDIFDVIIGEFLGGPLDLTSYNQIKLQVISPKAVPIQITLQDVAGTQILSQTATVSTLNSWEELTFDFSTISTNATVTKMVLLIDPNNPVADTFWLDNIRFDTLFVAPPGPCAAVATDSLIIDDFECQQNIGNLFTSGVLTNVANPNTLGINLSDSSGQYVRSGDLFDVIVGELLGAPLDLTTYNKVTMQVISPTANLPVQITLQDTAGNELLSRRDTVVASNTWEALEFDFSSISDTTGTGKMVLLINQNTTDTGTYFLDNIRLDTTAVVVVEPGPCDSVVEDLAIFDDFECQRNLTYGQIDGTLDTIANPLILGVNTSALVGKYDRAASPFAVVGADFANANVLPTTAYEIHLDILAPTAGVDVQISLQDNGGNTLDSQTATVANANTWETLIFDFSQAPANVTKVLMLFNPGNSSTATYYIDNFRYEVLLGVEPGDISDLNFFNFYPNPASDQVTIEYQLEEATDVRIQVQDIFGKQVANVLNEKQSAGSHELNWATAGLANGIYFIRIITEEGALTGKLVIRR